MSTTGTSQQISPQLAAIVGELEDVSFAWKKLVAEIGQEKLWRRPAKGGWSVGECIDHLTTSTRQMLPALDAVLPNAPKGDGPYRMALKGRLLVGFAEPPYRMKTKTVANFQPKVSDKDVLAEFLES